VSGADLVAIPASRLYSYLCRHGIAAGSELSDMHLIASILTISADEAERSGQALATCCGLEGPELRALFVALFPGAVGALGADPPGRIPRSAEESQLRDILFANSAQASQFERWLSFMIARRSLSPNHLWQDLGLRSRRELGTVMYRHFPRLVARNRQDMKWKKFFYRMICSSTGYTMCVAPVCSDCDDFDQCFGPEDGDSLLARIGNGRFHGAQGARA
jgi:nitrogen fixation protein NifQ